jgi:hypothetical protein
MRTEMQDLDGDGVAETPGLLIEGTRTNYFLNNEAPACQRVGLAPGWYYLSVAGCGASVTIDARWSVERNRRSWRRRLFSWPWRPWREYEPLRAVHGRGLRFEVTAQTRLQLHVHGAPIAVQLEDGLFANSYIPTQDGPVTRAADSLSYVVGPAESIPCAEQPRNPPRCYTQQHADRGDGGGPA